MANKLLVSVTCLLTLGLMTGGCTKRQLVSVALSGDPEKAVVNMARSRARSYQTNPLLLVQDVKSVRSNFKQLVGLLSGNVGKTWGKSEVLTPGNKRYVKYTQNYLSRAIVSFDTGMVRVETLDEKTPNESLRNAIVTTLLTPDDPRAVDLYSASTIKLSGKPYLYDLLEDRQGRAIGDPQAAETYADYLVEHTARQRKTDTGKLVHFVELHMVRDFENRQARRYAPLVRAQAQRFDVSPSLVFAVIKTESNFNPFAVSSAPAYGLMQLVPTSGGRDAYRHAHGSDGVPDKDYLFQPQHNIELGTAYLDLIEKHYLGGIDNPLSREYCTIAAYNGGAGNVLRVFSPDRAEAVAVINSLSPSQVYQRLRQHHPRQETRRYLVKVLEARKEFVSI